MDPLRGFFACAKTISLNVWQAKIKTRAFANFRFSPHFSAMFGNDLLDNSQPHTGSFKFTVGMKALKYLE